VIDTREFLTNTRRRVTGGLLGYVQSQQWYRSLPRAQQMELRQKVLDSIGIYHDTVLDVIKALDGAGGETNDAALELIREVHERLIASELPSQRSLAAKAS
jgi:hypothetical protein